MLVMLPVCNVHNSRHSLLHACSSGVATAGPFPHPCIHTPAPSQSAFHSWTYLCPDYACPSLLLCCTCHMRCHTVCHKQTQTQRALPPAPGHPGDLQELDTKGLLNSYDGKRNCCQGTWVHPGGVQSSLTHLLSPSLGGPHPVILILQEGAPAIASVLSSLLSPRDAAAAGDSAVESTATATPPSSIITVLGDDAGLTQQQQDSIRSAAAGAGCRQGVTVVYASLGPMQLLASQCITLVHHYLDLAVGPSPTQKPRFDPEDPWLDKVRPCSICFPAGLADTP